MTHDIYPLAPVLCQAIYFGTLFAVGYLIAEYI